MCTAVFTYGLYMRETTSANEIFIVDNLSRVLGTKHVLGTKLTHCCPFQDNGTKIRDCPRCSGMVDKLHCMQP